MSDLGLFLSPFKSNNNNEEDDRYWITSTLVRNLKIGQTSRMNLDCAPSGRKREFQNEPAASFGVFCDCNSLLNEKFNSETSNYFLKKRANGSIVLRNSVGRKAAQRHNARLMNGKLTVTLPSL